MLPENRYAVLSENCSLRNLETPCVYNKSTDELYELDRDGFEFLKRFDGSSRLRELGGDPEFVEFCFGEGIITTINSPHVRHFNTNKSPAHSLRYLELQITGRCNLRCGHCYLSAGAGGDLELIRIFKAMDEFDAMQGLRLIISGGEPLLHKRFWYINEKLEDYGFRSILLTNGALINRDTAARLKVHEVQISIDGMREAHDALRGPGTFDKAVWAIGLLNSGGMKVSVATTVNALNQGDFNDMNALIDSLGVTEWNIDLPSVSGRLRDNPGYVLSPVKAAPYISYGFGGNHHASSDGFACGSHLCVVGPGGQVAKCGFYLDSPAGVIDEGLRNCWERINPVRLSELSCDCDYIDACKGGCRFRAETCTGDSLGPDPVRCHNLGVLTGGKEGGDSHDHQEGG